MKQLNQLKQRKQRKQRKLTRREFVKTSVGAVAVAATATSGCATEKVLRDIAQVGCGDEYEFIVVGSGAGGGPVACNLAKAGYKVCLLEAGDWYPIDKNHRNYDVPSFHPYATEDPNMAWNFFVNHYPDSDPDQQKADSKYNSAGKGILYPRAGTVGGCTAHNAMITLYPDNQDWDDISAMFKNDQRWSSDTMRKYFQKVENKNYGLLNLPSERRSSSGWLTVEQPTFMTRLKDIVNPQLQVQDLKLHAIASAAAGGIAPLDLDALVFKMRDANDWSYVQRKPDGAVKIPKATKNGKRNGVRELIQSTIEKFPGKLTVRTNSLATKIILDGPSNKAIGVEYMQGARLYKADSNPAPSSSGQRCSVKASREVILAGGAFNTPQLLMLSGLGPADELSKHGIALKQNLPGVGKNLQDRYEIGVVTKLNSPFDVLKACTFGADGDPCLEAFDAEPTTAMYGGNGPIVAMVKRSDPKRKMPDLCVFAFPGDFRGYYTGWAKDCMKHDILTWAILKGHTKNTTGTVTLKSADPMETPVINFNYFNPATDPNNEDLNAVLKGIDIARTTNSNPMIKQMTEQEILPGPGADLKTFVKNEAWGHHASCTAKMGPDNDPLAVLDGQFRVRGTQGLRVVDASVFPKIPGLFIALPIFMVAEKASVDIITDARKKS